MKTDKIVVHGVSIADAQSKIDAGVVTLPHVRIERQGTKTRLFGPTGGPVLEFRAATFATCLCDNCKHKREMQFAINQHNQLIAKRRTITRLYKPFQQPTGRKS